MIVSTIKELQHYFPTAKWDKCEYLLPLFKETEQNALRRQIGEPLLSQLNTDYSTMKTDLGLPFDDSEESIEWRTLTAAASYIVRLTLANNVRTFSTTLNRGGGWNMSTSDNFESPDENQFKALSRELYMLAQDALENLCLVLEDDANGDKVYTDLWKGSRTYWYQHNLLIPTADALQPYIDIDCRREKYTELVPVIKRIQNRVIVPRIGTAWLNILLSIENSDVIPSSVTETSPLGTSWTANQKDAILLCLDNIRQAIALYVLAENLTPDGKTTDKNRERMQTEGDTHIAIAINAILALADTLKTYICGTPLDYEYSKSFGNGMTLTQYLAEQEAKAEAEANGETYNPKKRHHERTPGVLTIFSRR